MKYVALHQHYEKKKQKYIKAQILLLHGDMKSYWLPHVLNVFIYSFEESVKMLFFPSIYNRTGFFCVA